jgi:2-polyprenyl-6-methoxyphenol hydroxylase-like FAD-dependent oxidoreductase
MTKALIIGGGIAGPVTAAALHRAGMDSEIFEAYAPTPFEVGSYLTIATNGLDALAAVDALEPVARVGFPSATNVLWSSSGKPLGHYTIGGALPDGTASQTVKRARLYGSLHDFTVELGIPFHFEKRLVDAETCADGSVVARFADGTEANGDLLIGCDGVHSATRRIIDPTCPPPRYVNMANFGGYTPDKTVSEPGVWHMIFGKRAFFGYVADPFGGTVWFVNVPCPEISREERENTPMIEWQARMVDLLVDDTGPAAELVANGVLELAADNTYDLPSVPLWHRGSMIIVGDAAHAPSSISGQGASMAIEGAVVLAKCLRDLPDTAQAFAAYEDLRRARVERMVEQVARGSSNKTPGRVAYGSFPKLRIPGTQIEVASRTTARLGQGVRDLALKAVFKFLVTQKTLGWTYDHHIDWQTPVGADLAHV